MEGRELGGKERGRGASGASLDSCGGGRREELRVWARGRRAGHAGMGGRSGMARVWHHGCGMARAQRDGEARDDGALAHVEMALCSRALGEEK